jgi:uncharacterized membrane protein YwzB
MSHIIIIGFVFTKEVWWSVLAMNFDPSSRSVTIVVAQLIMETM